MLAGTFFHTGLGLGLGLGFLEEDLDLRIVDLDLHLDLAVAGLVTSLLFTFASCGAVPSQINWVLSAFSLRRFDDIHLFMASMHAVTHDNWAVHWLASV